MKYIAKMMLALLASVTLVIPAYAWDFSASGTMEARIESLPLKNFPTKTKRIENINPVRIAVSILSKSVCRKYNSYY